jgi:hypothetical protein
MIAMRMMQVAANAVVDVIAVRHRLMAATRAMHMTRLVAGAAMVRGAAVRVIAGYLDHMLVDMAAMRMVQMAVMQIVDMAIMPHRRVATARPMLVGMLGMLG